MYYVIHTLFVKSSCSVTGICSFGTLKPFFLLKFISLRGHFGFAKQTTCKFDEKICLVHKKKMFSKCFMLEISHHIICVYVSFPSVCMRFMKVGVRVADWLSPVFDACAVLYCRYENVHF